MGLGQKLESRERCRRCVELLHRIYRCNYTRTQQEAVSFQSFLCLCKLFDH